ncbi:ABC transporter permease [Micromonospora sp. KC606]|uniref:FtsX-like permease family protein n=1 Tax=Micromonospora sp. KC606 TaxID=2530379 RepID=UPI001049B705|nr:ABC transporter permease [Micromonospora sp. KC606]TDC85947.1 ABC transporter permease [Micromonospora sp. KC606]
MALSQWRVRLRRSLALLSMIAVAVAGFTLLTGAAATSRLDTVGTVAANYRPVYDLLVRPKDAVLPLERQRNLVQSGQLAGMRGGITVDQWREIQAVRDVSVAAPVAVVGYVMRTVPVTIDLSDVLDPTVERQVLRVQPTWVTDAGLSQVPDGPAYLYVTRNRLDVVPNSELRSGGGLPPPEEVDADGQRVKICPATETIGEDDWLQPTDLRARSSLTCVGGVGSTDREGKAMRPAVTLVWTVPFLMAAVDPDSEAALAGLDRAVTSGRYFTSAEQPTSHRLEGMPYPYSMLPILIADRPRVDTTLDVDVRRLDPRSVDLVRTSSDDQRLRAALGGESGMPVTQRSIAIEKPYRSMVDRMLNPGELGVEYDLATANTMWLHTFWTVGPANTTQAGDGLRAEPAPYDLKIWGKGADDGGTSRYVPRELADTSVRDGVAVHRNLAHGYQLKTGDVNMPDAALGAVGTFDPAKVSLGSALSAVPMDTYFNPGAGGADEASRQALGGKRLSPNANVTGLLSQPPLMLTTMQALPAIFDPGAYSTEPAYPEYQLNTAAPISVVRVRLAGDVGIDAVSRERVRVIAEEIARRTGLQVDITLGSSPTAVTVHYPAGDYGRPDLALAEPWVQKGVAAVLVRAADRKSVLLSILVLAVCALAVLNANTAAIRARRTELGVLACLGWHRRQLAQLMFTEIAGVGLAAGIAGTLFALAFAFVFGLSIAWTHTLLAIPAAVALALLAGGWPVWRAARPDPGQTIRPAALGIAVRRRAPRRVATLALANLARTPGRTLLGAMSLTIGVAALTMLLAITFAFRGAVTGTLLGEVVTLQARTVDHIAVAVTIVLGIVSVADVLYLNISERAAEFALFGAVGWTDAVLRRLVVIEAIAVGVIGGTLGAAAGLGAAAAFAGGITTPIVWCAVAALPTGVAVSAVSVVVPVAMLRRLPTAQLLAEG